MKKIFSTLLIAALFAGCANVRISHEGGRTVAAVSNTAWYLLNFIPLASGNHESPNGHSCKLFRGTTTLENNMKMLDYAVRKEGAVDFGELVSYTTDESVLFIFLKRHSIHTSAELILPSSNN